MPIQVSIEFNDILTLIGSFLVKHGLSNTLHCLVTESNRLFSTSLNFDMVIIRSRWQELVYNGRFGELETELATIASEKMNYSKACFLLKRQDFFEMMTRLEEQVSDRLVKLVEALKLLEPYCEKKDYKELCGFLILTSVNEHEDYKSWTVEKGRMDLLEKLELLLLDSVKLGVENNLDLLDHLKMSCLYQMSLSQGDAKLNSDFNVSGPFRILSVQQAEDENLVDTNSPDSVNNSELEAVSFSVDLRETIMNTSPIRCVDVSPTCLEFAFGSNSKSLHLANLESMEIISSRSNVHAGSVYCCKFDPSGTRIATGSNDQTVKIIGTGNSQLFPIELDQTLIGHTGVVRDVLFDPFSNHLYSAGAGDNLVRIWDHSIPSSFLSNPLMVVNHGQSKAVCSLALCGENMLCVAGGDGVKVFDLRSGLLAQQISTVSTSTVCHAVDSGFIFTGLQGLLSLLLVRKSDGAVSCWDLRKGQIWENRSHQDDCRTRLLFYLVAFSHSRSCL